MVREPKSTERVRLAPADWGGLCSLTIAILSLVGATLYQVHDLAATNRATQVRFEIEITNLKAQVRRLQEDVRELIRREMP